MNRVYAPATAEIIIYAAGKTWMAQAFKRLRDVHGFKINSRWIDHEQVLASPDDEHPPEVHADTEGLREIWDNGCKQDTFLCDTMVMACRPEDGNNQSGALVELGNVSCLPECRPVYILGTCASVEPHGTSDRAWKQQANVYHWPQFDAADDMSLYEGFSAAARHFRQNYAKLWNLRRAPHYRELMGIDKVANVA